MGQAAAGRSGLGGDGLRAGLGRRPKKIFASMQNKSRDRNLHAIPCTNDHCFDHLFLDWDIPIFQYFMDWARAHFESICGLGPSLGWGPDGLGGMGLSK